MTAKWADMISGGSIPIIADRSVPLFGKGEVFFVGSPKAEDHISSLILAKEAAGIISKNGWDEVVIVCAPDYANRVVRDIKKVFGKNKYVAEVRKIDLSTKEDPDSWYDRESTQIWTRYRIIFRMYEFILMNSPFWLYEWVTG